MKSILRKLTVCALLGASTSAYAAVELIPNGDFEDGATNWIHVAGNGDTAPVTFPTGGNPGGYGTVTPVGGWGILVSPTVAGTAGGGVPIADLGLTAGSAVTFTYDSINLSGPRRAGGFKWEAWGNNLPLGDTGDTWRDPVIGDGSTWETYTYVWVLPEGTEKLIFVPLDARLATADTVGFDNIGVDNDPGPPPPFVPDQIPNGDFEIPNGADWFSFAPGGPTITFETTGGSTGPGHAVIDATENEGFAAIEAFGGAEKTFASLGLAPGDSYTIQLDMKILEGSSIGGVQLVGGNAFTDPPPGQERPTIIGDGSTWETYSIPLEVPPTTRTTQARFTLLWGFQSKVAYDNVMIVLPGPAGPLQATIAKGTSVSWTAASETNQYQPQQSADNSIWTNLGPAIVGNAVSAVFDANPSPFYRVLESTPSVTQTVYNGDFSVEGDFEDLADGWTPDQSQAPFRLTTGGLTGDGDPCMQLKVLNAASEPNGSEISQDTIDADFENPGAGAVVPGNSYTLSFWAKQISGIGGYLQEYRVSFLAESGAELPPGGGVWQTLTTTLGGDWEQKTLTGLVAPAGAVTALIQIVAKTGANLGEFGEVLIDDVSLESTGFGAPTVLAAAALPAVEISWPSSTGESYQVQSSTNLVDWPNFGGVISGNNTTKAVYDTITPPAKFYRVGELP